MGLFKSLLSTAADLALTPVEVVRDIADVMEGKDARNTTKRLKSAADNVEDAVDSLI